VNEDIRRVAEDGWAPGADEVDEFTIVRGDERSTTCGFDEKRRAAYGAEGANGGVHAARNELECASEESVGIGHLSSADLKANPRIQNPISGPGEGVVTSRLAHILLHDGNPPTDAEGEGGYFQALCACGWLSTISFLEEVDLLRAMHAHAYATFKSYQN
jgi:hypothetical protein